MRLICPTEWPDWFVSGLSPSPPYPDGGGAKRNRRPDMAVSPFPVPAVGSPGCCEGKRCCNAAAMPRSAPWPQRGCRRLAVEQFVAKRPIEAFVIAILPW